MELQELKQVFEGFSIADEESVLLQCKDLLERRKITSRDLAKEWEVFITTTLDLDINDRDFQIDSSVIKSFSKSLSMSDSIASTSSINHRSSLLKPAQPIAPQQKSFASFANTFGTTLVPGKVKVEPKVTPSFVSPRKTLQSESLGETVTKFTINEFLPSGFESQSHVSEETVRIQEIHFGSDEKYTFICESMEEVQNAMQESTKYVLDAMLQSVGGETSIELADASLEHSGQVWLGGRILHSEPIQSEQSEVDQRKWEHRIDQMSVILVTYPDLIKVQLDISHVSRFSVFPGQIVLVKGITSGNTFMVSEFAPSTAPPRWAPEMSGEGVVLSDPLTVLVCCGPYSQTDDLHNIAPLERIMDVVNETKPCVVLMGGPFLDERHKEIENLSVAFEDYFTSIMSEIYSRLPSKTQLILIPSLKDVSHDQVFPQPRFPMSFATPAQRSRTKSLGNPFMAFLDKFGSFKGITVGASTCDALMDLSRSEFSQSISDRDRMSELAGHLISQHSFYPVFPPHSASKINLQPSQWKKYSIGVIPDILISQSVLSPFIKAVDECIVINPGSIIRGNYAEITVHHQSILSQHNARCRVDIKRLY